MVKTPRGDAKASVIRAVVREDLSGAPGQSLDCGKKEIIVACGKYALQILEIAPSGSKAMPAAAFRNGLRGEKAEFIFGVTQDGKPVREGKYFLNVTNGGMKVLDVVEADMAKALGQCLYLAGRQNLCIDRVQLSQESFLDIGTPVGPAIPVVVKTLILSQ